MVSALDFRSGGRWFEPGNCHVSFLVSFDKKLYFALPLFTQVYKWVPAGVTLRWASIPSTGGGGSNIPSRFMLQKPELSAGLMDHVARKQTFFNSQNLQFCR